MLGTATDLTPPGISLRLLSRFLSSSCFLSIRISSLVLVVTDLRGAAASPPARSMLALDCLGLIVGALTLATSRLIVLL